MLRKKVVSKTGISLVLIVGTGSAAIAQSTPSTNEPEEIVVTGSRIARPQVDAQVPIAVVDATAIRQDGALHIEDILNKMPQVGVNSTRANSNFNSVGTGAASVDLRNLGANRTLVLVNGRRYVSGFPGTSAVDLNNIPVDFIERVEVITGGASAIYGSDAVSGVINFILKNEIDGIQVRTDYGITSRGDDSHYLVSASAGTHWGADDRGRFMFNYTYDNDEGLMSRDRALSREDRFLTQVGVPAYSSYAPQGRFDLRTATDSARVFTFDHGNNLVDGFPQELAYNRNGDRRISVPVERHVVSANITHDVGENMKLFIEPTYSKIQSSSKIEAYSGDWSFIYNEGSPGMPITNAYIPAAIRDYITMRNSDGSAANDIVAIQFRRRMNDVFDRSNNSDRDTWRLATGLRGSIGKWNSELSYVYGRMQDKNSSEDINATKFRYGLDAIDDGTGKIVCRDASARAAGCVPINLFGFDTVNPDVMGYVTIPHGATVTNTQHVLSASVTGSLLKLPAGDLGIAFGGEYRKERSVTDWDAETNAGNVVGSMQMDDLAGEFDVYEVFGEANIPILTEKPFVHYLGGTAAARYSDYSTAGRVFSWNSGIDYEPVRDLRFRANYAKANRAPSVNELYSANTGGGGGGATLIDPCAGVTLTSTRPQDAKCRAIPGVLNEIAAGGGTFTYTGFDLGWMTVSESGNPNLEAETATTTTIGAVLTPAALPGFRMSTDYFNIKIDNAIGSLPGQVYLDRCFATANPLYCDPITRYPTGKIRGIESFLLNVSSVETSGVDANLVYNHPLGLTDADDIRFELLYTRLLSLKKRSFAESPIEDNLGQLYAAGRLGTGFKHRANGRLTYSANRLSATWQVTYMSKIQDRLNWVAPDAAQQALNDVGEVFYHNVQLSYAIGDKRKYAFALGVDNVFDRGAPLIPMGFASSLAGVESAKEYDPYGRRFYASVRLSL
ncbi:MAG: TonB-dependent receptor [Gammaproteobacteria bacterium]